MTYSEERDRFLIQCHDIGIGLMAAKKLMALANRHCRLMVAECNGTYPSGGDSPNAGTCPKCEGWYIQSTIKKSGCPECRCEKQITDLVATIPNAKPVFQGDPRGCTVKLAVTEPAKSEKLAPLTVELYIPQREK